MAHFYMILFEGFIYKNNLVMIKFLKRKAKKLDIVSWRFQYLNSYAYWNTLY